MHLKDTTLLILNYERPGNLVKICERFQDFMPIEIINNNPTYSIPKDFYGAKIINNKENMYCIERWYRAIKCKTPYVCLLTNDILPYKKTILDLRKKLLFHPNSLIGIYGKSNKELNYYWCINAIVDIVANACTIVSVQALKQIFNKYIIDKPNDIIISLMLTKYFGELHQIINTEVELLPRNNDSEKNKWKILQENKKYND